MLTTTQHFETLTEFSNEELQDLLDRATQELNARSTDVEEETFTQNGHDEELPVGMEENATTEEVSTELNLTDVSDLNGETGLSEAIAELNTEMEEGAETISDGTSVDSGEAMMEAPSKNDIEIKLDEMYSIRVVANEVVNGIEDLQAQVRSLQEKVNNMVSAEELEQIVKEMVATALRERFV
ncbi:MAG: hypothetical protein SFU99_03315 [Saprospiraceae bacterium]|nr:hypothetical protein [Saprospiraceae bacterium]